jgi:hypothetical protein
MAELAACAHCAGPYIRRRADHRFCCPEHRKLGERRAWESPAPDPEQVKRLFDGRPDEERARPDDWHPGPPEFAEFDAHDRLAKRRRWFSELRDRGML